MTDERLRTVKGLWLCLVGSVVHWIGVPWPIVGDYYNATSDAAREAVVDGSRGEFAIVFGLLGLGASIAAIGLWVLGRGVAELEDGKRASAARIAGWLGLLGVVGGLGGRGLLPALFATPDFLADDNGWFIVVTTVPTILGTTAALIILGVLGLKAPPPTWACVVLIIGGIVGTVPSVSMAWYLALIVFAIANLVQMRRGAPVAMS